MDAADILDLAIKNGLDDRENLVSFALGFARGASTRDSADPIHLYGTPAALAVQTVHAFLVGAKIPHQYHVVDILRNEHHRPEFEALNPYLTVPVITHTGGFRLHESHAILRYICRVFPNATSKFYGEGDFQTQALIDAALDERLFGVWKACSPLILPAIGVAYVGQFLRDVNTAFDEYSAITMPVGSVDHISLLSPYVLKCRMQGETNR